jgi:hypothetical protein
LSTGSGKETKTLLNNIAMSSLTITVSSDVAVGTEYTGTVTSDNYQTITFKVTAAAAEE